MLQVDEAVARNRGDQGDQTFALRGVAYRPNTDDMRAAPSRRASSTICRDYGKWTVPQRRSMVAEALPVVTEWQEFCTPHLDAMREALKDRVVFDGRNLYKLATMRRARIEYHAIGRPMC